MKEENIQYKRDMSHNYLIIKGQKKEEDYQLKMITNNHIEGILVMQKRIIDGELYYYYEISSMQPMNRFFDKNEIGSDQLKDMIWEINNVIGRLKEFLLDGTSLVFEPNHLYFDVETMKIGIIFYPDYDKTLKESFCELVEYILERVDHSEEKGVFMAYQLYKITRKPNFTLSQILYMFESGNEKIQNPKKLEIQKVSVDRDWKVNNENSDYSYNNQQIDSEPFRKSKSYVLNENGGEEGVEYQVGEEYQFSEEYNKKDGFRGFKGIGFISKSKSKLLDILTTENKEKLSNKVENEKKSKLTEKLYLGNLSDHSFKKQKCRKDNRKRYLILFVGLLVFCIGIAGFTLDYIHIEMGMIISGFGVMMIMSVVLKEILMKRRLENQEKMEEIEGKKTGIEGQVTGLEEESFRKSYKKLECQKTLEQDYQSGAYHRKVKFEQPIYRKEPVFQKELVCQNSPTNQKEPIYMKEEEEIEIKDFFEKEEIPFGNTVLLGTISYQAERKLRWKTKGKEQEYSLEKLPITIGKIREIVDITINEKEVSRIHARFFEKNNLVYLEDLNSTNGTFKNGIPLETNEIVSVEPEDEILIGKCCFIYS